MEELARETGNPGLAQDWRTNVRKKLLRSFAIAIRDYLKCDSNWRTMMEELAHHLLGENNLHTDEAHDLLISEGHWTITNLEAAFNTLVERERWPIPQVPRTDAIGWGPGSSGVKGRRLSDAGVCEYTAITDAGQRWIWRFPSHRGTKSRYIKGTISISQGAT